MKPLTLRIRRWMIAILTVAVLVLFVSRLMQIQIVDAEIYKAQLYNRRISTQVIKAVRGEIVDSSGTPFAANRMGYDVIIDMAFFPSNKEMAEQNKIILDLITLLEQQKEEWNDSLPVSRRAPFSFESGYDDEIARLKKMIGVLEYATADDAMYWLVAKYKLEDYSTADARKIAGVRYDMEQRGFNMQTPYTFASDVDISTVIMVKERSYEFLGVDVIESASRYNPVGDIAPHLIGTVGPIYQEEYAELKEKGYALNDVVGKSGIEKALEDYLRGTDGKREIFTDSYGDVIEANESLAPIPGNTVKLTINSSMQRIAQEALEAQIKFLAATAPAGKGKEADSGAVVAIEIKTGKVLAAATYPSYDLNSYKQNYQMIAQDPSLPLVNRAINGQYAPGSTFKPCVSLAGLRSGVIDEFSTVNCTMSYSLYPQFKCLDFHGPISVNRALSLSCNIFFYDVGRRATIDVIDETAAHLGLGESTGIEVLEALGQRSNPVIKKATRKEDWFEGDTIQTAIGQYLSLYSPLQLANYAATIGNKGNRMKLTLVDEIWDYSMSNLIQPFEPVVADRMSDYDPEFFDIVTRGMVSASRTGSARGTFANYPVDVAAKTGTPETVDLPNSTFICFAPADDPQIAVAVVIEKGWHGYTGASVAKALFDEYLGIEGIRAPVMNGYQQLLNQRARDALAPPVIENEGASSSESSEEGSVPQEEQASSQE